ncbi:MAG TPA: universal stress protein [Candidatus Limnocylindria bacterium]
MQIILGTDGSPAAKVACDLVTGRDWPAGTHFVVLTAASPMVDLSGIAPPAGAWSGADLEAARAVAETVVGELRDCGLSAEADVAVGDPAQLLIARADERPADLIVVGHRGRGPMASAVLGSVSAYLVDHAPCPVLVARVPTISRMLLATDGTPSSLAIPRVLNGWGVAFRGLSVEVLCVAQRDEFVTPWAGEPDGTADRAEHERIAERVADEMLELGWSAAAVVRSGEPAREIVRAGDEWRADLIVTGSRGLGPLRRIVAGSVGHDVLLHAHSSVLVVRGHVPARVRTPAFAPGTVGVA